jgi:hypothetical protein
MNETTFALALLCLIAGFAEGHSRVAAAAMGPCS